MWYNLPMSLQAICKVECDMCGEFYVLDRKHISMFIINKEVITATRCPNCNDPIIDNIDRHTAKLLTEKGVKAFSFNDGEQKKFVRKEKSDE